MRSNTEPPGLKADTLGTELHKALHVLETVFKTTWVQKNPVMSVYALTLASWHVYFLSKAIQRVPLQRQISQAGVQDDSSCH